MNRDLRFSAAAFGLGSGIFFIGYALFEVPSNLLLARVGARWWIARIMITWGVIAAAMAFVRTPTQFYALRFLLGVAEAGFFPGIVYYMSQWFPSNARGRASAKFMMAIPLSGVLGGAIGGALLRARRTGGPRGMAVALPRRRDSVGIARRRGPRVDDRPPGPSALAHRRATRVARGTARARQRCVDCAPRRAAAARARRPDALARVVALPLRQHRRVRLLFWGPTIIRDALHTSDSATSLVGALFALVTAVVMLLNAAHSDRTGERIVHAACGSVLMTIGFVATALLPWPVAKVLAIGLVPIGGMMFLAPYWCLPPMMFRGAAMAVAIGLVNSIGNLGGFLGPNIIGVAKTLTGGTTGAFMVLAVIGVLSAASLLALRRHAAFATRI